MIPVIVTYNRKPYAHRRLLATDLEGTLTPYETMEVIGYHLQHVYTDLDGRKVNMYDFMIKITQGGMRGKRPMPFSESLKLRIGKVAEFMPLEEMRGIARTIPLRGGAKEALQAITVKYDIAVITGGIHPLAKEILLGNGLGVDYLAASGIESNNGRIVEVYPLTDKGEVVRQLVREYRYEYVVGMGDGSNDKRIKEVSNRFIWVNPKDGLVEGGDEVIDGDDLGVLVDKLDL